MSSLVIVDDGRLLYYIPGPFIPSSGVYLLIPISRSEGTPGLSSNIVIGPDSLLSISRGSTSLNGNFEGGFEVFILSLLLDPPRSEHRYAGMNVIIDLRENSIYTQTLRS